MENLTENEQKVYSMIMQHNEAGDGFPSCSEIDKAFGCLSVSFARRVCKKLAKKGLIKQKTKNKFYL